MKIGIGLPSQPGTTGQRLADWAMRADAGPFSSLGMTDRLIYGNIDPLMAMAAAAVVTRRVELITSVIIAPLHTAGTLAKQALSLDALSGGRFTLGVGIGSREPDCRVAPTDIHQRGKTFETQLEVLRRALRGEPLGPDLDPIGPLPVRPGGVPLLIGGLTPVAVQRVSRWADGFIAAGRVGDAAAARQLFEVALESWRASGRAGRPLFLSNLYFGLGPNGADRAGAYLSRYYARPGQAQADFTVSAPSTPAAVRETVRVFEDAGLDEVIFQPAIGELDQVDRLADAIG
ncbi:MAG: LLM class flavin-dependent oxidoreductase [Chloroflexi bacterium]|nr:LLM class flavin-dependent oxidoreductase [Chloroflexota bacterium]